MNSTSTLGYIGTTNETSAENYLHSSSSDSNSGVSGSYNNEKNATSLMKVTANGLCAFLAISATTYVQPVIEDKVTETFIGSIPFINLVTSTLEQEIDIPIKANNPELVKNFLSQNPEITEHLNLFASVIPSELLGSSAIEHYKDIEEHWEKLFLLIDTGIEDFDRLEEIEDELYGKLIEPLPQTIQEKIVLTVS